MRFRQSLLPVLCAIPWALLAQTPPNLTGVWEVNKEKTNFRGKPPERMRMKIEQQGSNLTFVMRVLPAGMPQQQQTLRYVAGAESRNDMHGAPMTSRTEWDGQILVVRSAALIGGKELRMTDRWSLSAEGKVLTWREAHEYGTDPQAEEAYVLDRQPDSAWEADAPPKMAEEVYKNIQILKGAPSDRVMMAMNFFTTSLGVQCAFCHVAGAFDKDDKPAKLTARAMWKMADKINVESFKGPPDHVTCWTCHRGQSKPQITPPR